MHGQFVWYDLLTSDLAAAKKFYPAVLGWKAKDWEYSTPEQQYTLWTQKGVPLGGVAEISVDVRAQGVRPHWVPTIEVRNVDEAAALASSLGGRVQFGPDDVTGTGRYVSLTDPQGVSFAMYTPALPTPAFDGTPVLGRFSWHELMTTDYRAAFEFYRKLFDWEKTSDFDVGGGHMYLMFGQRGQQYGGIYNRPIETSHVAPNWLSYVSVKDVRKTTSGARRAGARLVNGPMEVPGGDWIAAFTDPQGASFAIHQTMSKRAATSGGAKSARKPARKKAKAPKKPRARPRKKTASRKSLKQRSRPRVKTRAKKRSRRR